MIKDNPDLEDALDGLYHAHVYALDIGENEMASEIFNLYQEIAKIAPEDDWDYVGPGPVEGIDMNVSAQEAMKRNPLDEEEDYD